MSDRLSINQEIRAKEVRLIGPTGEMIGVVPLKIAIDAAAEADLDLVEVAPNAKPPVAKVMDYGKHLYEQERAARDQRKKQKSSGQKAIRLRPKTDDHDFETKVRQARKFLQSGHSVRFQVMFRMRELRRPEMGLQLLDRVAEALEEVGQVDTKTGLQGRFATLVVSPKAGVSSS